VISLIAIGRLIRFNAPMLFPRILRVLLLTSFTVASVVSAEGTAFRPALVGNGPQSLVNQIDAQKLAAKGQGNAASCSNVMSGIPAKRKMVSTYRGTPDSKRLAREVELALQRSYFIPAIYNRAPVSVIFAGAALFCVVGGKPQLHIYANQNPDDLKQGKDFIAPHLISGTNKWEAAKPEIEKARLHQRNGAAELAITVDLAGRIKNLRVASKGPLNYNFGRAALKEYASVRYIPGFRNGKPVECVFNYTSYVQAYRKPQITRLEPTFIGPQ
jgi:hypothetical protein